MRTTIIRYGIRAAIAIVALSGISLMFISKDESGFHWGEVLGYLAIFLSMIFVYIGIRHYRDHQNGGVVSFGQALKLGVLITLFPAIAFGIYDQIYVNFIDPDFYEDYYQVQMDSIEEANEVAYEARVAEIKSEMETFSNPIVQYLVMFATVLLIGLVVSIISGLILKRDVPPATG